MAVTEMKTIWGVPLSSLFPMVLEFYRKEKDNIILDYGQRVQLLAFYKQEKSGPYTPDKDPDTGYLDIMGMERRRAWKALGNMSREEAQQGLVSLLDAATPRLRDFISERWRGNNSSIQQKKEVLATHQEGQEQGGDGACSQPVINGHSAASPISVRTEGKQEPIRSALAPASIWCSPRGARPFISQVQESSQSQLVLSPSEKVSVQVHTSSEASAVFWEFATGEGDIGFGLSFQQDGPKNDVYPVAELLPVVNRNCSEDLVLGSHQYQVSGTYFLHFDNSHCQSSKVVYYKVFYQRTT